MIDPLYELRRRNSCTGAEEEIEDEAFSSARQSEVEKRAAERNEARSPEEKERFEYFCSGPKSSFRGLQLESLMQRD